MSETLTATERPKNPLVVLTSGFRLPVNALVLTAPNITNGIVALNVVGNVPSGKPNWDYNPDLGWVVGDLVGFVRKALFILCRFLNTF